MSPKLVMSPKAIALRYHFKNLQLLDSFRKRLFFMPDQEPKPQDQQAAKPETKPDIKPTVSSASIAVAADVIGLNFTDSERELMAENVAENRSHYEKLRTVTLENSVAPAFRFDPRLPGMAFPTTRRPFTLANADVPVLPSDLEEVAFWPVTHLAHLIQTRQVSSLALTQMYLERLKRYDPALHCVVTLTEDLALAQARRADSEIANGHYRGPLHGIPWGVKDILSLKGIPTTWGAAPYKDQVFDVTATVIERLEAAGAVLLAKLSVGELAMDDVWFGGKTRTPWNLEEGSSGSSAGSGSATAAGLCAFTIGTETLGSIVSPSTRCRVTGLRPTFGRVSRYGAMALVWSMDKIGPMCRSVEDCALVFNTIYGPDGKDLTVTDYPFNWTPEKKLSELKIGYLNDAFEEENEHSARNKAGLEVLRSLGINLIPLKLPDLPIEPLGCILEAEAAASFDELTRSNRDEMLVRQLKDNWPNLFRQARLIPAVEFVQASRLRTLLMRAMADLMEQVDVYVAPSFGGNTLVITNYTGHPAVVVPNGVTAEDKPSSLTFTGKLYGEAEALLVAKSYQDATDFHLRRPNIKIEQSASA
jgi:Asp-tRNA(Asn)/Glu-tRNA(Gln) amidotransferase A subunit family amidase